MANIQSWVTHFEKMALGTLPPGSKHIVRAHGGGATRSYYRVNPTIISSAQQVVNQAEVKVKKPHQGKGVVARKRGPTIVKLKARKVAPKAKRGGSKVKPKAKKGASKVKRGGVKVKPKSTVKRIRGKRPKDILS